MFGAMKKREKKTVDVGKGTISITCIDGAQYQKPITGYYEYNSFGVWIKPVGDVFIRNDQERVRHDRLWSRQLVQP